MKSIRSVVFLILCIISNKPPIVAEVIRSEMNVFDEAQQRDVPQNLNSNSDNRKIGGVIQTDIVSDNRPERYLATTNSPHQRQRFRVNQRTTSLITNMKQKNQLMAQGFKTIRNRTRQRTNAVKSKVKNMISNIGGNRIKSNMKIDSEIAVILLFLYALFQLFFGTTNSPTASGTVSGT